MQRLSSFFQYSVLFFVCTIVFAFFSSPFAVAQEVPAEITITPSLTATLTPTAVDYTLPYPGLLPDSPLYPLKTFRDRIISFLISDPVKKAEFNLLQADKRLNAGIYLVRKGDHDLAEQTISKGENYFEYAIGDVQEAKRQGISANDIINKLFLAAQKHQLVLADLEKSARGEDKKAFQVNRQRVAQFETRLQQLSPATQ